MMKIAIFYQKESKLLGDIRKKIRKEACQPDNVYAIYEYSTIKALRKANEQSPMDIVFLEDTIDNCGLTAAKYIRETGQKTSLYFFGKSANRAFYGYELLWSSIFVTLMANKIGGLQFGIYRNCQISSRVFHTAVAALPLTKANRSDFE